MQPAARRLLASKHLRCSSKQGLEGEIKFANKEMAEGSAKVAELTVAVDSLTGLKTHFEELCSGLSRELASRDGELAEAAEYLQRLNVEVQELRQQLSETLDDASEQRDRADTAEEVAEEHQI